MCITSESSPPVQSTGPVHQSSPAIVDRPQGGVDRWLVEMVQYWLDSDPAACWERLVRALEQLDLLVLAATIKQKHLWEQSPSECLRGI